MIEEIAEALLPHVVDYLLTMSGETDMEVYGHGRSCRSRPLPKSTRPQRANGKPRSRASPPNSSMGRANPTGEKSRQISACGQQVKAWDE